jgi:hypothetical protein
MALKKPLSSGQSNSRNSGKPTSTTPTRNTPFPRGNSAPAAKPAPMVTSTGSRQITREMVAKRAFEIHMSGKGGSQDDNWFRAERELRAMG